MHDFFLSYTSQEATRAAAVAGGLRRLGQTVWMDDEVATDDDAGQLIGIPVGQSHWAVIEAAIDQASTLLVLDSQQWRASPYCRKELAHARSVGKRIAVAESTDMPPPALGGAFIRAPDDRAPDDDDLAPMVRALEEAVVRAPDHNPAALVRALEPGAPVARAYARLQVEATGAAADRSSRWMFGQTREQARDAELITTSDLASHGLASNPAVAVHCERLLAAARRRRYTLMGGVAAGLAVLVALAAVTVVGFGVTRGERAQAAEAADRAQSLGLAQQARHSATTARALELARAAEERDSNTSSRGVLAEIEGEAAYRQRMSVPVKLFSAAAVSDDGMIVLAASPDTVTVADLRTATSRLVPLPEPLTRSTLVLTPNGRTGYAVSELGHLLCLDVPSQQVSVAAVEDVAAVDVASDGAVWWVNGQAQVRTAPACPEDEGDAVFTASGGITAFDVHDQQRRLVGISSANVVTTFGWLEGEDPRGARPLATVALAEVPTVDGRETGPPSDRSPSHVMHCGDTVHVAGGVRRGLPGSTHVAFDLEGRPLTGRSTSTSMRGLGCGPDDQAWAVPLLTPSAVALPEAAAHYPVGLVDSRDNRAQTLVAESAGQRRTAVVHMDGRIDVLDGDRAPWGREAGNTALAVPLRDGTVLVDDDGTVSWEGTDGRALWGNLGGSPDVDAVGSAEGAYIPVDTRVVEITKEGIRRTFQAPARVTRVTLTPDGTEMLAETDSGWTVFSLDFGGTPRMVRQPDLPDNELISSVQIDGDRSLVTTQLGRLHLVDEEGKVLVSVDVGVAGKLVAAFRADHGVVAIGQDGTLRSFTPDLEPERSTLFGAGGIYLRQSADGGTLLVSLSDFSVWAVDPETLEVRRQLGSRSPDVRLVLPGPDGSFAERVLPGGTAGDRPARLEHIPLA